MQFFLYPLISLLLSLTILPFLIKYAHDNNILDIIDNRKIHSNPTPRLGGLAFVPIASIIFIFFLWHNNFIQTKISIFIICIIFIFIVGMIDDIKQISAKTKLFSHIFVSLIFSIFVARFEYLNFIYFKIYFNYPISILFTSFWIVGIINAMNLIDGMDALAGGVGVISHLFLGIYFIHFNEIILASWTFIFSFSILGFLWFNKPKATIFMGDAGSLTLGFSLATLVLMGDTPISNLFVLVFPGFVFIALIDTLGSILRRIRDKKPIMSADKKHTHHKLIYLGLSVKKILTIIYSITIIMNFSILMIAINNYSNWFYIIVWAIGIFLFYLLHKNFYSKYKN